MFGMLLQMSGALKLWLLLQTLASTEWQLTHNTMENVFRVCWT